MTVAAVLDLETTGKNPEEGDLPVEVAITWLDDANGRTSFECLFNPGRPIPPEASAVHHITDGDVAEARPLPQPDEWIALLASADYIVAHNAQFDRSFLPNLKRPWICTWRVALHLWPAAPGHGLQVLRYFLDLKPVIPSGVAPHRASYDVACCVALLQRCMEEKRKSNNIWEWLVELTTKPVILERVSFGKHRGQKWADVPRDYLAWILSKDFDEDVRHTARHHMNGGPS